MLMQLIDFTGFYSGLALSTSTARAPLKECSNNLKPLTSDQLPGIWDNICTKNPYLMEWNLSIRKSSFVLCLAKLDSSDSFISSKTLVLNKELQYKVYVGDVMCDLLKIGYQPPSSISSPENLIFLLNVISGSKPCFGCRNTSFSIFGSEVLDGAAKVIGRLKSFSSFDDKGFPSQEKRYFSTSCHALLPPTATRSYCEECASLDKVLRLRLFRATSTQPNATNVNHRYMSIECLKDSLANEKSLRRNAERRESYSKKKLNFEIQSKQLTSKDHGELKEIFNSTNVSVQYQKCFADKPEMNFFWNLQKEMLERNTRKWHPRYYFFIYSL